MGRHSPNRIVHLFHIDPARAKAEFLAALRKARGVKSAAAALLGITPVVWSKWMERYNWRDDVAAIVEEMKRSGAFPTKAPGMIGIRDWEVVDRNDKRLGTYSTKERAEDRAGQTPGARVKKRRVDEAERARAIRIATAAKRRRARDQRAA
jgi:hypothetical protein